MTEDYTNNLATVEFEEFELELEDSSLTSGQEEKFTESELKSLAQKANGINNPTSESETPSKATNDVSQSSFIKPDALYLRDEKKLSFLDPKRPFLKIIVGIILTSISGIIILVMGTAWYRLTNISQAKKPQQAVEDTLNKEQQEIDHLRAQLAFIKQDTKTPQPEPQPKPEPEPVDPYERWEAISQAGTMGSTDLVIERDAQTSSRSPRPTSRHSALTNQNSEYQPKSRDSQSSRLASINLGKIPLEEELTTTATNKSSFQPAREESLSSSDTDWSNVSADAQSVILDGLGTTRSSRNKQRTQQVPLASIAKAKLTTPIVWTDNSLPEETRGTLTLIEPLRSAAGDIALPVNSSVIVEVSDWSENGSLSLDAIAIVYQDRFGEFQQQEIPPKTLLIRDENNSVLKAEAKKIDRNSESTNILNNVVKAGSSALPREARAILGGTLNRSGRSSSSGDNIYQIDAKTPVSVYVNSLFRINHD